MEKLILILVFCWTSLSFGFQESVEKFDKANAAYNNAKYERAAELYNSIIENGQTSVDVYFNLGNAYLKQNKLADAIYAYEKALAVKPNAEFVYQNLAHAQTLTIDQFSEVKLSDFQRFINRLNRVLSIDQWAYLVVFFAILMCFSFVVYLIKGNSKIKRTGFISFVVFLLLASLSFWQANRLSESFQTKDYAILFDEEIEAYDEPNQRSEAAVILHEGTKMELLSKFNDYREVRLPDGAVVWMRNANFKEI
ncbi:MAG: tetratricopeptide repeat protein [Flavobacteriaceae bacterium]|nr:tetratricopeptide repeat protein [Psychroflexus sp.]